MELLRDARRLLAESQDLALPAVLAEAACRLAIELLLKIADDKTSTGIQGAARAMVDAVDAHLNEIDSDAGGVAPAGSPASTRRDGAPAVPRTDAGLRHARDALQAEIDVPGGYRNRLARRLAESVTGLPVTAAGAEALRLWSSLYSRASGTVHGETASELAAVDLFNDVILAVGEVFVPLPARAGRVLTVAAEPNPTREHAYEIHAWSDPRAITYFFAFADSPGWLGLLRDALLLPSGDAWDARPFLDRIARTDPGPVANWLRVHWDSLWKSDQVCEAACRIATRCGVEMADSIRAVVRAQAARANAAATRAGEGGVATARSQWIVRAAADWALAVAADARNGEWVATVEPLVDAAADDRLDHHTGRALIAALRTTAHPDGAGTPGPLAKIIRNVLPGCLDRMHNLECEPPSTDSPSPDAPTQLRRPHRAALHFVDDLRVDQDAGYSFARPLAHAILKMARADAAAHVSLTDRTAALRRKTTLDDVRDRLLAAHLADVPPPGGSDDGTADTDTWWDTALEVIPGVMPYGRIHQDTAAFLHAAVDRCPPEREPDLDRALTALIGPPPDTHQLAAGQEQLAALARHEHGARAPREWLHAWDLQALLPDRILAAWRPALSALRAVTGGPPPDPRHTTIVTVVAYDAVPEQLRTDAVTAANAHGPVHAARTLAASVDTAPAHTEHAQRVVRELVTADDQAWSAAPRKVADALRHRGLIAAYLNELHARHHDHRTHLTPTVLVQATLAGHAAVTRHPDTLDHDSDGLFNTTFALLRAAQDVDTDLGTDGETMSAWLREVARHRTDVHPDPHEVGDDAWGAALSHPPSRAAYALITDTCTRHAGLSADLAGILDDMLAAADPRPHAVIGYALPILHTRDPDWVDLHQHALLALAPGTPSPARSWLRHAGPCPALLARLDPDELRAELCVTDPDPAHRHRADGALHQVAHALVTNPALLGAPGTFLTALAAHDGGPDAVSHLLELLPRFVPDDPDRPQADHAARIWTAVLDADVPDHALATSGVFAVRGTLDSHTWLTLAVRTRERIAEPGPYDEDIAERAAGLPDSPDALHLLVGLLEDGHLRSPWQVAAIQGHAKRFLSDSTDHLSTDERTVLRDALIASGDLGARLDSP
ncbi:hypothetical protein [Embleya sp. NBC_00896]|uniref:hypothetical protein n=1 Tax=Embleya sp. NBC_00896 TaxID=2975961 RepID=UPI002F90F01E|nr:hypothetical protein OG928_47180 [Embleya sp. NBC_00896]